MESPIVSILMPSIGRPTILRALISLLNQSNPNWVAFVGFDGCQPPVPVNDRRITYVYLDKVGGGSNHGGMVRNALMPYVTTDWICFLDDDDTFRSHYVEALVAESQSNQEADCIVFRMSYHPSDQYLVLPPIGTKRPQIFNVGISFAVRRKFLEKHQLRFVNDTVEDFILLNKIEEAGGRIFFSEHITYNVRF